MNRNRRKTQRYTFTQPIAYTLAGSDDKTSCTALTLNIATHGMCVITPHALNEGGEVVLETDAHRKITLSQGILD